MSLSSKPKVASASRAIEKLIPPVHPRSRRCTVAASLDGTVKVPLLLAPSGSEARTRLFDAAEARARQRLVADARMGVGSDDQLGAFGNGLTRHDLRIGQHVQRQPLLLRRQRLLHCWHVVGKGVHEHAPQRRAGRESPLELVEARAAQIEADAAADLQAAE